MSSEDPQKPIHLRSMQPTRAIGDAAAEESARGRAFYDRFMNQKAQRESFKRPPSASFLSRISEFFSTVLYRCRQLFRLNRGR